MKRFSVVALVFALSASAVACSKKEKSESATTAGTTDKTAESKSGATPSETKTAKAATPTEAQPAEATPSEAKPSEATPGKSATPGESATPTEADKKAVPTKITHLDAKASHKALTERKPAVLDIRTAKEFAEGHIEGALNIDFYAKDFAEQLAKLDTSKEYLLHCRSGGRSGRSLPTFEKLGFEKILHMDGGMNAWVEAGLATKK